VGQALAQLTAYRVRGRPDPFSLAGEIKERGPLNRLALVMPLGQLNPMSRIVEAFQGPLVMVNRKGQLVFTPSFNRLLLDRNRSYLADLRSSPEGQAVLSDGSPSEAGPPGSTAWATS
jgi:hypothetical protein